MHRLLVIGVGFILGLGGVTLSHANPLNLQGVSPRQSIQSQMQQEGRARVIIRFKEAQSQAIQKRAPADQRLWVTARTRGLRVIQSRILGRLGRAPGVRSFPQRHPDRLFEVSPMMALEIDARELEQLEGDPEVESIVPDGINHAVLQNTVPLIGMTGPLGAFDQGATGSGWSVAVLDSGVQLNHPFLASKILGGACFSTPGTGERSLCPNGDITQFGPEAANAEAESCLSSGVSICWHGTHVAGIAVGLNPDPGIPPSGVAKASGLLPIQVFTRPIGCNAVSCLVVYDSDALMALEWVYVEATTNAVRTPLAAVNMSFSGGSYQWPCDDSPFRPIIRQLQGAGIAAVAATGNASLQDNISSPACVPEAIAVGATNLSDKVAAFSNQAPTVDLLAPGVAVLSAYPVSVYKPLSGTSMASPHVAGAVAAMRTLYPTASLSVIEAALRTGGVPVKGILTRSRIDVPSALRMMGVPWRSVAVSVPSQGGVISSDPYGLFCTDECRSDFLKDSNLSLVAIPRRDYRFVEWTGDCAGTAPACTLVLDQAKTAGARFQRTFNVGVAASSGGKVTSTPQGIDCPVECEKTYDAGTTVELKATPDAGYFLRTWRGACEGNAPICRVTVESEPGIRVIFEPGATLSVTQEGEGQVISTPGGIDCGKDCLETFEPGTSVTLKAHAAPGFKFEAWSGDCAGSSDCLLEMSQDRRVIAHYQAVPRYALRIKKPLHGKITGGDGLIDCGLGAKQCQAEVSEITLTALAAKGYRLKRWKGCPDPNELTCPLNLAEPTVIGALFSKGSR